jgi:hypothetical protein
LQLTAKKVYFLILRVTRMVEHYVKAAKALDIDVDKIWSDMARALVREELTREERKKMRKEMK